MKAHLSLREAFEAATNNDGEKEEALLERLRYALGAGQLTATGRRDGKGERVEIPAYTWADYCLHFAEHGPGQNPLDGGYAIPETNGVAALCAASWEHVIEKVCLESGLAMRKPACETPAIWTDLRFKAGDILKLWPPRSPVNGTLVRRRRGRPQSVGKRVEDEMRRDLAGGYDLSAAKEEELATRHDASRKTCRSARDKILLEINSGQLGTKDN